jgi:hypothetical protein
MFDDGDHLAVVLKQDDGSWVLSDEGHTMMHLTYEMDEKQLLTGTRQKVITNALSIFSVSAIRDCDGERIERIKDDDY